MSICYCFCDEKKGFVNTIFQQMLLLKSKFMSRIDQNRQQIQLEKTNSEFVVWGFVKTCDEYQTDLYLLELSHQMTDFCLLISDFLPVFDCSCHVGNIKLFCTSKNQNKNNSVFLCCKYFQILVNFQKSTNNFMSNHG